MLAHDAGNDGEVLGRRRNESTDALNGLCNERSNPPRSRGLDEFLHVSGAADPALWVRLTERTAVAIGVVRVNDAARGYISDAP